MYYYLLYNSSLINNNYPNQKFIVVTGIGSILYMITHAITFHTNIEFLKVLRYYFWNIFMLDVIILSYKIWGADSASVSGVGANENLKLSINLLKNRIYDMLDGSHTIKITDDTVNSANQSQTQQIDSFSTPITKIKKQNTPNSQIHISACASASASDNMDLTNPFDTEPLTHHPIVDTSKQSLPTNPLVYNPKIDIPAHNPFSPSPSAGVLPPPMIIKKGSSNDYTLPTDRNIRQPLTEPVSTNIKYGFSTTMDEDLDAILMNSENKSIASDVASVIDLEGF